MKRSILLTLLVLTSLRVSAQETEIRAVVDNLFQAMYKRDTAAIRDLFIPAASLLTFIHDSKGNPRAKGETVTDFIRGVSLIGEAPFEERLMAWHCLVDAGIASVWTPYEFYFEGKFSHCGVNSFELISVQGKWKISQLTDTRRKDNCYDPKREEGVIDSLMNTWHHAAAVADEETFFGLMTPEAVYIGTDPTERWLRDELKTWSAKYFARESAWDFKPVDRHIRIAHDGMMAWTDELLDTWMGKCRGTGILRLRDGQWRLVYYHLAIAVPNDKINSYLDLLK